MRPARPAALAPLLLIAALAGADPAVAQTATAGASAAACVADSMAGDTVRQVVYFTRPYRREQPNDAETRDVRALLAAQEIVPWFHAPARAAVAEPDVVDARGTPTVDGMLAFVLAPPGRVEAAEVLFTTRAPVLDSALVAAVHRADSAGAFHDLAAAGSVDTMLLRISADSGAPAGAVPLFRLRRLRRRLDDPARVLHMPPPRYPAVAQTNGIGDRIVTQFIIGRDGRAEPASLRFISGRYREFAEAARASVLKATFKPGMSGGCPVRQLVELPFTFGFAH